MQLNQFSCLLPQYSVPRRLFCFYTRQGNLVSSCVYWMCLIWQIWYCTCCNLIAFVSFVWLPMYNIKLHLLQKNCIPFMCLAPSIQLPKQSNSVSTPGKETLSLYVCIKCDSFDKYKIAFVSCVWLPQYIWPIRVILHRAMKRCLFMCVLNVFHLKKMNLHLLQSNVKLFLLASQDAVEVMLFTHSLTHG